MNQAYQVFDPYKFKVYTTHFNQEVLKEEYNDPQFMEELQTVDYELYCQFKRAKKRKARYLTRVEIRRRTDNSLVVETWSMCGKNDQPKRKLGFQKALGRAIHACLEARVI